MNAFLSQNHVQRELGSSEHVSALTPPVPIGATDHTMDSDLPRLEGVDHVMSGPEDEGFQEASQSLQDTHGSRSGGSRVGSQEHGPQGALEEDLRSRAAAEVDDEDDTLGTGEELAEAIARTMLLEETVATGLNGQTATEDSQELPDSVPAPSRIEEFQIAQDFVNAVRAATPEDSRLDETALDQLHNPIEHTPSITDPNELLSIELYLATDKAPLGCYERVCAALHRCRPDTQLLSLYKVKKLIRSLSGIFPIKTDMCVKGCHAYTGSFASRDTCFRCDTPRYKPAESSSKKRIPQLQFTTIPIGPSIQALRRNPLTARKYDYLRTRITDIREQLTQSHRVGADFTVELLDDFCSGTDIVQASARGDIGLNDTVLMYSIDGAQLYRNKKSDCWISIFIILNFSPDSRLKKAFVHPSDIIPGPNKPGLLESFQFVAFSHLSAIQKTGIKVWDAASSTTYIDRPFLAFATADTIALAAMSGGVGHQGKLGCRYGCGQHGRRKEGASQYFPAILRPLNCAVAESSHPDISYRGEQASSDEVAARHAANLEIVRQSENQRQYEKNRLNTGLCKPSIVSGLPSSRRLSVPGCFPGDNLHLPALNITDLFISLWRGKIKHEKEDKPISWPWAVFLNDAVWKAHGAEVAALSCFWPGSFDRIPRNPAEKISSGYKAWEFMLYFFAVGPMLFFNYLPQIYYENICKLIVGQLILYQHEIPRSEVVHANELLVAFCEDYEALYYQRIADRLDWVRQSVHNNAHLAPKTLRVGPNCNHSQWAMERSIGDFGMQIRQPSNPYANLAACAARQAQANAVRTLILDPESPALPRGSVDLGNGYVLLCAKDELRRIEDREREAIAAGANGLAKFSVARWARLRLPNGQIAQSLWKEKDKAAEKLRVSRNVQIYESNGSRPQHAEVLYFFQMAVDSTLKTFAMVSMYTALDDYLLQSSHRALRSYLKKTGDEQTVKIIDIHSIHSVVAMMPHKVPRYVESGQIWCVDDGDNGLAWEWEERWSVAEKPGL